MNSGVSSLGKFILMTYTVPVVPVMSVLFEVSLMLVVIAVVRKGIILSIAIAITMLPMAIGKAHSLVTMLAIPFVIGVTIVWTMS